MTTSIPTGSTLAFLLDRTDRHSLLGASGIYGTSLAFIVPFAVFLVTHDVATFDLVFGWIPPLSLVVGLLILPGVWRQRDWAGAHILRQFAWQVLGILALGGASTLTVVHAAVNGQPLPYPGYTIVTWCLGGGVIGLVVGVYDVGRLRATDRATEALHSSALAQRQSEQLNQRLSVLNRVLRHDVRNRMNVIVGYSEEIVNGDGSGESKDALESAVTELIEVCDEVREFERFLDDEGGAQHVDAGEMIARVVDDIRTSFPDATVVCETTAEHTAVPAALEIALRQVIENAVVHTSQESTVTVSLDSTAAAVELVVEDDGSGLPRREALVLDEGRETQLLHSRGLGLWMTRWAVDIAGGSLEVESGDSGTTVTMRVERAE